MATATRSPPSTSSRSPPAACQQSRAEPSYFGAQERRDVTGRMRRDEIDQLRDRVVATAGNGDVRGHHPGDTEDVRAQPHCRSGLSGGVESRRCCRRISPQPLGHGERRAAGGAVLHVLRVQQLGGTIGCRQRLGVLTAPEVHQHHPALGPAGADGIVGEAEDGSAELGGLVPAPVEDHHQRVVDQTERLAVPITESPAELEDLRGGLLRPGLVALHEVFRQVDCTLVWAVRSFSPCNSSSAQRWIARASP